MRASILFFLLCLSANINAQSDKLYQEDYRVECIQDIREDLSNLDFIFEYEINETDTVSLLIYFITEINYGTLINLQMLTQNYEYEFSMDQYEVKETIVERTNSYQYTEYQTQTINEPGGIDIVVQPDGTHKQVIRNATTKTVNTPVNKTGFTSENKIMRQHKFRSEILPETVDDLRLTKGIQFVFHFEEKSILLSPSRSCKKELKSFLK